MRDAKEVRRAGRFAAHEVGVVRFWSKVDRSGGDAACWPWIGAIKSDGYGSFWINGKSQMAHQIVLEQTCERPSRRHEALHSCGVKRCCNPSHLRWGSHYGNSVDCSVLRERKTKLSPEEVGRLVEDALRSKSYTATARRFGVGVNCVSDIMRGHHWNWLTGFRSKDDALREEVKR